MSASYYSIIDKRLIAEKHSWIVDRHGLSVKEIPTKMNGLTLNVGDTFKAIGRSKSSVFQELRASDGWHYEYLGRLIYKKRNLFLFTAYSKGESIERSLIKLCQEVGFKKPCFCFNEVDEHDFMFSTAGCSMRRIIRDVELYDPRKCDPAVAGSQLTMNLVN